MKIAGDARGHSLLVLLVMVWGASSPAAKIGVSAMPPVWFACLRYFVATVCAFGFVAVSGILQMVTYSALTAVALTRLPPGRASVLAFSTPLWVAHLTWRGLVGVGTGPTATAFAHWAAVEVGRVVRATTMSMVLLAVPGLGLLLSAIALHESLNASLEVSILLIGAGIWVVTNPPMASLDAPERDEHE